MSRHSNWGKSLRWWLQGRLIDSPGENTIVSRNNAMRPPISFLAYYSEKDTDILQEYFVPIDSLTEYLPALKKILLENSVNVLSMTLRYVPKSEPVYLNYAPEDIVSVVLYMNIRKNSASIKHSQNWTRKIVDLTYNHGGKYYLTYHRFPTLEQFRSTYNNWKRFKSIKKKYDRINLFTSEFYKQYFQL